MLKELQSLVGPLTGGGGEGCFTSLLKSLCDSTLIFCFKAIHVESTIVSKILPLRIPVQIELQDTINQIMKIQHNTYSGQRETYPGILGAVVGKSVHFASSSTSW